MICKKKYKCNELGWNNSLVITEIMSYVLVLYKLNNRGTCNLPNLLRNIISKDYH